MLSTEVNCSKVIGALDDGVPDRMCTGCTGKSAHDGDECSCWPLCSWEAIDTSCEISRVASAVLPAECHTANTSV